MRRVIRTVISAVVLEHIGNMEPQRIGPFFFKTSLIDGIKTVFASRELRSNHPR